jgi:hypothetical protein
MKPAPALTPRPTPPAGTVARASTLRRTPPPPAPVPGASPPMPPAPPAPPRIAQHVVPPISAGASERANATQLLSEEDLMPSNPSKPPPTPNKT